MVSEFCWTPSCEQARDKPYVFTVIVEDDGCPPKNDKENIEIFVRHIQYSIRMATVLIVFRPPLDLSTILARVFETSACSVSELIPSSRIVQY